MTADEALKDTRRLLLDSNPVIHAIESYPEDPVWTTRSRTVWAITTRAVELGIQLVVSPLTLAEVLSKPSSDQQLLEEYQQFCLGTEHIVSEVFTFDDHFARSVASIGRATRLKHPDCVQFAFAQANGCDAILTNDAAFAGRSPVRAISLESVEDL